MGTSAFSGSAQYCKASLKLNRKASIRWWIYWVLLCSIPDDVNRLEVKVIRILSILEFQCITRQFSNHESCLLSRSHTFAIIVILDLKIHQSMWIHWPFFPKTWTKGHWPVDDLWPHVCWGHMCDSTQGSLCPSPVTIHQCMWIEWSILQITTYIHIPHTYTYYVHTTYRMSDHIVSYWTQFRRDKNWNLTRLLKIHGAISRTTELILGLFVLMLNPNMVVTEILIKFFF